jgi:hypothetical protein
VSKLNKPFYEWPQWIDDTLRRMMLREKYGYKTKKQLELMAMAKDTTVTLIDPGFKVVNFYF